MAQGTRIKDIATTATSAASDDFLVVDGATNGTRKIAKGNLASAEISAAITTHNDSMSAHGGNSVFAAIRSSLARGQSQTIIALGDSTANERGDWPGRMADFLSSAYPEYTTKLALWDEDDMTWLDPVLIATGSGGEAGISVAAGAATAQIPLAAAPMPETPGTLEFIFDLTLPDWSSSLLLDRAPTNGNRAFRMNTASNRFYFSYSADGGATLGANQNWLLPAGFTANSRHKLRYSLTLATGAGQLHEYTGGAWAQIGSTITSGAISLFQGTSAWSLYGVGGTWYEITAKADGKHLLPLGLNEWIIGGGDAYPPKWLKIGSPELLVLAGGHSGATISTWTDEARVTAAVGKYAEVACVIIALGLNQGYMQGAEYVAALDAQLAMVRSKTAAPVVYIGVNPKSTIADYRNVHQRRIATLQAWSSRNAVSYASVYDEFVAGGVDSLLTDTVHPNAAGYTLYGQTIAAPMLP